MSHLAHFGIENFKVFKGLTEFEFRPITILTGTNSSGKSSLIKGILLAKEIFKNISNLSNNNQQIDFNLIEKLIIPNRLMGNFENLVNRNTALSNNTFSLVFPIRFTLLEDLMTLKLTYSSDGLVINNGQLIDVKIILNKSKTIIFHFWGSIENAWQGKVKFSTIYKLLSRDIKRAREVNDIFDEIKFIHEKYDAKINPDTFEIIIPKEGKKQIENLQNKLDNLFKEYRIIQSRGDFFRSLNGADFDETFHSKITYYHLNFHQNPITKFNFNQPLLNYSFLLDSKELKKRFPDYDDDELLDWINKNRRRREQFELKYGKNWLNNLIHEELKWLDSITFFEINNYDYTGLNVIKNLSEGSLFCDDEAYPNCYSLNNEFKEFLGGEEFLIKSTFNAKNQFVSNFEDNQLNFHILLKEIIYNGFVESIKTLSRIFKSNSFVPSDRASVNRLYFHEKQSELHQLVTLYQSTKISNTAISFMNEYTKMFSIADSIEIESTTDSIGSRIFLVKNDIREELADMGYGYSQLLPIVLKIAIII